MPSGWVERKRLTEYACADVTHTHPDTLYKMLHSKQVGKASVTGMRVLRHIRSRNRSRVAIWPFETVRSSAIVEIYPTMFRKMASGSTAKLRSISDLNKALLQLGSRPMSSKVKRELSDHETDALLSAAGLRTVATDPDVWVAAESALTQARKEGWIFGVPCQSKT